MALLESCQLERRLWIALFSVLLQLVPSWALSTNLRSSSASILAASELDHKALYTVHLHFDLQRLDSSQGVTVILDPSKNELRLDLGVSKQEGLAWGRYDDKIESTGWSDLFIETSSKALPNDVKVYSAGFIEGVLTCVRLSEFNANVRLLLEKRKRNEALMNVRRRLRNEMAYVKSKIGLDGMRIAEEPSDNYWKQVRYVFFQLWGICDGYNKAAKYFGVRELSMEDMMLLNVGGELPQLLQAFAPEALAERGKVQGSQASLLELSSRSQMQAKVASNHITNQSRANSSWSKSQNSSSQEDDLDDAHWEQRVMTSGKCSAFLRLAQGKADLLMGHTTWDDYSKMTRVYKYYTLHLDDAGSVSTTIAFSSYPGLVSSTDDFYMMDAGLTVMDTTLIILDERAWEKVPMSPTLPNFLHVMATNRLARTAPDWAAQFLSGLSGTYTSQWIVVDFNQFTPSENLKSDSFWLVEAVPGVSHAQDMTEYLSSHGYFASYNRPFFTRTRAASGHSRAQASHGALYSFEENPRAKLFAKQAHEVNGITSMRGLMSENQFPHAGSSAGHQISARMDLLAKDPIPNGGIDSKITNYCLHKKMMVQARSGPSHESLAPFRWTQEGTGDQLWPGYPHIGQPDVWNFDYVQFANNEEGEIQDGAATLCD
mmetsp:Transcript_57612/g.122525  ORF Transcript_57612/g.122525 Transcript_57612/m.122525 type:complete len:657 (-) Transcript_57612:52-2022(-)